MATVPPDHSRFQTPIEEACAANDQRALDEYTEELSLRPGDLQPGLEYALANNHLNLGRYLLEKGVPINSTIVRDAIVKASLPTLDLLREFGWEVCFMPDEPGPSPMPLAYVYPTCIT